jgi:aminoglycoside phosphotransferase (APT) family kinase protein
MHGVYRQIGELLAAIHEITQPEFGYLTTTLLDPAPHNTAYMTAQFRTKLAEFAERGGDPEIHRLASDRVAERSGLFGLCAGATLCHNDLHEGNVLVDTDWQLTGFVDVENAIAADPLMDLAKTVQYELTRSPVKFAGLLAGYGPLPADGLARIRLYRLYHALELWDWFAEIGNTGPLEGIASDIRELASP